MPIRYTYSVAKKARSCSTISTGRSGPRRAQSLGCDLHGAHVRLRLLNRRRATPAHDVVVLKRRCLSAAECAKNVGFGDFLWFGGAAIGVAEYALILRQGGQPDNSADVHGT